MLKHGRFKKAQSELDKVKEFRCENSWSKQSAD